MAMASAAEIAQQWVERMGASTEKARKGVQRVSESPGQKAAQAADLWQQRVSSEDAKRRFQSNVGAVTLEEWRQQMLEKGIGRMAGGAQAAKAKFQRFWGQFGPFLESVTAQTRAMPKGNLEANIARLINQIRGTSQFRKQG